jgi:hypothetical protein
MHDISEINLIKLLALNFLGATSDVSASISHQLWPLFETMPVDLVVANTNSGKHPDNWRIAGWMRLTKKGHNAVLYIRENGYHKNLITADT